MGEIRKANITYRKAFIIPPRSMRVLGSGRRIEAFVPVIKTDLSKKLQNPSHLAKINYYSVKNILSADPKVSTSYNNMESILKAFSAFRTAKNAIDRQMFKIDITFALLDWYEKAPYFREVPHHFYDIDSAACNKIKTYLKQMCTRDRKIHLSADILEKIMPFYSALLEANEAMNKDPLSKELNVDYDCKKAFVVQKFKDLRIPLVPRAIRIMNKSVAIDVQKSLWISVMFPDREH